MLRCPMLHLGKQEYNFSLLMHKIKQMINITVAENVWFKRVSLLENATIFEYPCIKIRIVSLCGRG